METANFFWKMTSGLGCITTVVALLLAFRFWRKSKTPTRERFAFWAVGAIFTFALVVMAMLFGKEKPVVAIVNALARAFHWDQLVIPETAPTFMEYGFVLCLFAMLIHIVVKVHSNWHDSISREDHLRQQRGQDFSLLSGALAEWHRRIERKPVILWNPQTDESSLAALGNADDSLAWHEQAAELMVLSSPSYSIDRRTGWKDKPGVWIGTSQDGIGTLAVIPAVSSSTVAEIEAILNWLSQHNSTPVVEIHILVRGNSTAHLTELTGRATICSEESMLDALVNWSDYQNEIHRRFAVEKLTESTSALSDVYVHSKVVNQDRGRASMVLEDEIDRWLEEPSRRQLALLGDYGMGKSSSALAITHRLLSARPRGRIPLLIELRGKSPRNQAPLDLLGAWCSPYRISARALMRLHAAGRLLLIFEGFDEMALIGDGEMRLKHFASLWDFCFPRAKILITGRPNFFLDQAELKRSLGIGSPDGNRAYCEALRLTPFDRDQIDEALRTQPSDVREQILYVAEGNPRFLELVGRPSILHVASALWQRENLLAKAEQLTAADLMDLFVRSSYRRQGLKESELTSEFMALTEGEREFFMIGVAVMMITTGLPNQISSKDLDQLVEQLIESIPDSVSKDGGIMTNQSRKPLKLRISETQHGLDHVKTDVRTCGLLVEDPSSVDTFKFGHKSILEFLVAFTMFKAATDQANNTFVSVRNLLHLQLSDLMRSPEATRFFCELMISFERIRSGTFDNEIGETSWIAIGKRVLSLSHETSWQVKLDRAIWALMQYLSTARMFPLRRRPEQDGGLIAELYLKEARVEKVNSGDWLVTNPSISRLALRISTLAFGLGSLSLVFAIGMRRFDTTKLVNTSWSAWILIPANILAMLTMANYLRFRFARGGGAFGTALIALIRMGLPLHQAERVLFGPIFQRLCRKRKLPVDPTVS